MGHRGLHGKLGTIGYFLQLQNMRRKEKQEEGETYLYKDLLILSIFVVARAGAFQISAVKNESFSIVGRLHFKTKSSR